MLHNHQPVGNFGWVIEDVWGRAYEPMIGALERHPSVRAGLHYSGPLLEWMRANRPEAIDRLAELVRRGQVEILGGGYYEPILASLPVADRHGQLSRMADELEGSFGARPRGAWLAERVWEPSLPFDLAGAGYEYTVVDDNHLRAAFVEEDAMWGTYTTDDQGRLLTLFGTEQGLRYRIPWVPVDEVISHLRDHATVDGRRLGTMGDDGEKFGGWPDTYEYCWGRNGWVERFFDALEEHAVWLATTTPSAWLDREPPIGRIYVPDNSYVEMTEWALPADEAHVFHEVMERARETGDASLRFLRGAMWRNFQRRYREVNDLHKQMLRVSAKVAAMPDGPERARASDHLYQGQSNDCYWHGLFGGLYLVHMRMATLAHLIAAEDLADGGLPRTRVDDHDLDGRDEVLLGAAGQSVLVDLAEGAGIGAWDLLASRVALASVIRRRPEPYHAALVDAAAAAAAGDGVAAASSTATVSGADGIVPKSPHEGLRAKEVGLARVLRFDPHERRSGLVHVLPAADDAGRDDDDDRGPDTLAELRLADLGDLADAEYQLVDLVGPELTVRREGTVALPSLGRCPLWVTKRLSLGGERMGPTLELTVTLHNPGAGAIRFELDVEWDFNLMGGGGNPAAYYEVLDGPSARSDPDPAVHGMTGQLTAGQGERVRHDTAGDLWDAARLAFGNDDAGVRIDLTVTPPARLTWYPVETVSKSESGFERVYQGSSLHARWPVSLDPDAESTVVMHLAVHESRDLAAEERGTRTERSVRATRRTAADHPTRPSARRTRSDR